MENTMNTETQTAAKPVHKFEAAGLGKAPFRFVGMVGQDLCYGQAILNREEFQKTGISVTTKPGGSCDYCGTYIVHMFQVESADGKRFKVGGDCIHKTGDAGLKKVVAEQVKKNNKVRKDARISAAIEAAKLANPVKFAAELALLDRLATETEGFSRGFALDVADDLRSGRAKFLSVRQIALMNRLAAEKGIA